MTTAGAVMGEVRTPGSAQQASGPSDPERTKGRAAFVLDHLTKSFSARVAFEDVSLEVGYGEIFGLLGPNGAGKTTTVRTLGTLVAPTWGSAEVAGVELTPENGPLIRSRISIMPESPGLYQRLTVAENLECFARLHSVKERRRRIEQALGAVNLTSRADDVCGSLSRGLRQRVALARALLGDPAVLFLDEPTSGLDPVASREVHDLIAALKGRGVTIFLTTHRLAEAEQLCDRVAILNTRLRMVGRPGELRSQLFTRTLAVRLGGGLGDPGRVFSEVDGVDTWDRSPDGSYLLSLSGEPDATAPEVARALVLAGADIRALVEVRHSLEDIYLELIHEDVEADRP